MTTPEPGLELGRLSHCFVLVDRGLPIDVARGPENLAHELGCVCVDARARPPFISASLPEDGDDWRPAKPEDSLAAQELGLVNAETMADIVAKREKARPVARFDAAPPRAAAEVKSKKNFALERQGAERGEPPALEMVKLKTYDQTTDTYAVEFAWPFSPYAAFGACLSRFLVEL